MRLETTHKEKTRFSPQTNKVMVSHHNMVSPQMVSPQNGVTRGELPPSDATTCGGEAAGQFS